MKEDKKVEYELLNQTSNESKIDNLFNLYKKDPYKARVLYMNGTVDYESHVGIGDIDINDLPF
jgi:hypothetical protein